MRHALYRGVPNAVFRVRVTCLMLVGVMCLASGAWAGMVTVRLGTAPVGAPKAKARATMAKPPTAYVPQAQAAPKIDGRLTDKAWASASVVRLTRTLDGAAGVSAPTEVRLCRDAKRLYVAFRCTEPRINKVKAAARGHDGAVWADDSVEVFFGAGRQYVHLAVNPIGGTYDGLGKNGGFNTGFTAAAAKGTGEWTVEMAIPLAKVAGGKPRVEWIANFNRNRRATGSLQEFAWSPTYSGDSHVPGRFGKLVFGDPPKDAPTKPEPVIRKKQVTILPVADGEGVVRFDLSGLPKRARIVRADLRVFRSVVLSGADEAATKRIEIHPLFADFKAGGTPKVSGKGLSLRGPWYDAFDATDAVARWARGKTNGGFYVKVCPFWNAEGTCLDIAYEGTPDAKALPPQVTGVKAFHRAGQTFITFKESRPLAAGEKLTYGQYKRLLGDAKDAVRYRIYAHDKRITARNLHQAERIAEVSPLSAYNVNARSKEYLIGQAMMKADEIGELARHYNGEMHRWTMDSLRMERYPLKRFVIDDKTGPLPVGTGLYVHSPARKQRRYYAVVACKAGVENTREFSGANTAGPIDEAVGAGVPVRQGKGLWGPYFDYPGTRWVYVQWCAPPLAPRPNMYFNWSVLIPPAAGDAKTPTLPGMKAYPKAPAELYFHRAGYSYAQPSKKSLLHSIQIAPHDWPPSGWYGFNDAYGTLKSFKDGRVSNHTQQRIIAFLDWAKTVLPIDPEQIICAGSDGAAALALNFPDMFAYVWITGFDSAVLNPKAEGRYASVWGPRSADIADDRGRTGWGWADLDKIAGAAKGGGDPNATQRVGGRDLPLFVCIGGSWGRDKGYARGNGRFYRAMQKAHQPLMAYWGWSGGRNRGNVNKYNGVWRGRVITRRTPIPAFSNSSHDSDREAGGTAGGSFNWTGLSETPDTFAVTIISAAGTFDLTPRRCRLFKPEPGEMLRWTTAPAADPRGKDKPAAQSGQVKAGPGGVVTIEKLTYPTGSPRMTVTITRAK